MKTLLTIIIAIATFTASAMPADTIPEGARKLMQSYPNLNLRYADNQIIFPDGEGIVYDDGRQKSFIEQLDDCDIED
ncbi:MAG: hypothetical protein J5595_00780, partial [Bacteroidales bacterium]|nr:hypothetical protein [Bacteroidales bacterium]